MYLYARADNPLRFVTPANTIADGYDAKMLHLNALNQLLLS